MYYSYNKSMTTYKQPEDLDEAIGMYGHCAPIDNHLSPEFKSAWTTALRDPANKQAAAALHRHDETGDSYCCLGLLSKICGLESYKTGDNAEEYTFGYRFPYGAKFYSDDMLLGYEWARSNGIATGQGKFLIPFTLFGQEFVSMQELSSLNDEGFTFPMIADLIDYFF